MVSSCEAHSADAEEAMEECLSAPPVVSEVDGVSTAPSKVGKDSGLECNGGSASGGAAGSSGTVGVGGEETIEDAVELFDKGSKAIEEGDMAEAVDCLSRALEMRVAKYGELAPQCASYYYKYGCALLYKAQEEIEPLSDVPKNTSRDTAVTSVNEDGSLMQSSDPKNHDNSSDNDEVQEGSDEINKEDGNVGSDGDDELGEADEEDSDLDFAWKMLDIARAIVEKNPEDSMEKVNIFAALGEVSMEREDVETSLGDYRRALSILERLVEADNRRVVELNFRICLVLELGSKVEEAIPYCEKAISLCKSRLDRLREASEKSNETEEASRKPASDQDGTGQALCSELSEVDNEIEVLSSVFTELEKKLEDLQQLMSNPKSILTELLKKSFTTSTAAENCGPREISTSTSINSSQMAVLEGGGFDSPTISTAANNAVTHLGVVGRGIKRATVVPTGAEPPVKKPVSELSTEKSDSGVSEVFSNAPSSEASIQ
ncbi:hypothetical protein HPP92_019116 [Vanilla planifolia]|uniref:Tetratricopeptide SHNi-TPR domain-containing protein n=1 Tax=Vanilla planifolia TaxID=51239 RepID=A0A835QBW0_VANPL|nr:hypothetical protein HPP92_019116 [Vanilla planifolia]